MDKNSVTEIISHFKKILETKGIKKSKIILYGFYAKGTQREESDIDLVVISEDFRGKDFWERIDYAEEGEIVA